MNERILKLAEMHGFVNEHMTPGEKSDALKKYEKFAQLIVQECISTLEEKIYQSIDNDGDEVWADLILKEHFGVEE
jgi:hypothetical protein